MRSAIAMLAAKTKDAIYLYS